VENIYWLDRIKPSERLLVGNKALALSQLLQHGYPIYLGFAISSSTMQGFLKNLGAPGSLLADFPDSSLYVDVDDYKGLQSVAQKSRQDIIESTLPSEYLSDIVSAAQKLDSSALILRPSLSLPSSFKHKFSGLLSSEVCWREAEAIELALKKVWAELFSAKSIFYWHRAGIRIEQLNLAILVQPISNVIAAGTVTIATDRIDIRATWGLGHSIVKGEVLPDFYQIPRGRNRLINKQLGSKTRAYRLKNKPESSIALKENCLETYLLTQVEQEQYALEDSHLKKLIELIEHLVPDREYVGSLEWNLNIDSQPQIYLNQSNLYIEHSNSPNIPARKLSLMKDSQPILRGLAASPGSAIAAIYVITDPSEHLQGIPPGRILVTKSIGPDWLPILKKAAGAIAEQGGVTSHVAILARELGIPAVVGVVGATELLKTGELISLNGNSGEIYHFSQEANNLLEVPAPKETFTKRRESEFHYPLGTQLLVNVSQPSSLASAAVLPVDGVGLIRSELMLLDLLSSQPLNAWLDGSQKLVLLENLTQLIRQFASTFAPRPIFYRSTDWHSFGFPYSSLEGDINNTPKQRGTYNYLLDPTVFDLELKALAQVHESGYTNINLILPFVRSVEEFKFCRRRVKQAGLTKQDSFQLWIMAEVPSVLFLLPKYVEAGVRGIAIGTNDLTDLLLGVNREQAETAIKFNTRHPAMQEALKQLIQLAKREGIPCSICGQAPVEHPEMIDSLIRWGISAISVEPEAVEKTYQAIARAEKRLLLEAARSQI
jgi:pyruvate, water dikinase